MHSSSEHTHILHDSKSMIVSPINVETTFFVCAKVCYFAAEIDLINPIFISLLCM